MYNKPKPQNMLAIVRQYLAIAYGFSYTVGIQAKQIAMNHSNPSGNYLGILPIMLPKDNENFLTVQSFNTVWEISHTAT